MAYCPEMANWVTISLSTSEASTGLSRMEGREAAGWAVIVVVEPSNDKNWISMNLLMTHIS